MSAGYASAISFTAAGIAVGASLASLAYNTFRIAERQGSDLMMAETTAQKLETTAQKLEDIYSAAIADLSAVRQELTATAELRQALEQAMAIKLKGELQAPSTAAAFPVNVEQSLAKQDTAAEAAAEAAADEAAVTEAATEAAAADAEAALHARCDSLFVEQAFAPLLETLTAALSSGRGAPEQLLWRAARACKKLAEAEDPKSEVRMEHLRDGLEYATRALEAAPELGAAHKWYAILLGTRPGSTADKIKSSFAVKQHFDRAAELDPADPTSRHLVGLWCYEVARLSWLERKAASALFASPPEATYQEAYTHLSHAERLEPGFYANNRLLLAKCCSEMGQRQEARDWLAECLAMEPRDADDRKALQEAAKLRY